MQSLQELVSRVYTKAPYIIDDDILHQRGLLFIGGPPKAYKSFVMNAMCYHLATGTNLFGTFRKQARNDLPAFNVQRPYRVLLLEQEIGDFSLRDRFLPIANNIPLDQRELLGKNLWTHSCDRSLRLDTREGIQAIEALVAQCQPEIVCFDPLVEFHQGDENSTRDMATAMRGVDYLRDKFGVAVLMSHHCGKPSDLRGGPDALRGSSAIFGKGDTYLMLTVHNRKAGVIIIEPTLRRGVPIRRFLVQLNWSSRLVGFNSWYSAKTAKELLNMAPESDFEQ